MWPVVIILMITSIVGGMLSLCEPAKRSGDKTTAVALNFMVWHQTALTFVQAHGGAAYAGAMTQGTLAGQFPGWYRSEGPWQSYAAGGLVVSYPTGRIGIVPDGRFRARLVDASFDDAGVGYSFGGNFQSSAAAISFPLPVSLPDNTPVYFSRLN